MRITYLLEKTGPYHAFRLEGIQDHRVTILETRPHSSRYPWKESIFLSPVFLKENSSYKDLETLILNSKPEILFITGYGFKEMLWALSIGIRHQIPRVLISDTTYLDEPKNKFKEKLKSYLVSEFQSALVAGTRSRQYLASLGMDSGSIFQPYDIVDNGFYSEKTGERILGSEYFLCISRLIPQKNLFFLLEAFRIYSEKSSGKRQLVLLGNGILEKDLMEKVQDLGLQDRVHFMGFLINTEVRRYLQNAHGLILASVSEPWGLCINEAISAGTPVIASKNAGATEDLIQDSISGFLISPENPLELVEKMILLDNLHPEQREKMKEQASKKLEDFDLPHFLEGFNYSAEKAAINFKNKKLKYLRSILVRNISRLTNS